MLFSSVNTICIAEARHISRHIIDKHTTMALLLVLLIMLERKKLYHEFLIISKYNFRKKKRKLILFLTINISSRQKKYRTCNNWRILCAQNDPLSFLVCCLNFQYYAIVIKGGKSQNYASYRFLNHIEPKYGNLCARSISHK